MSRIFHQDPNSQHGFYQIEVRHRWMRITVAEGINIELVTKYQGESMAAINQLQGQPWGIHLLIQGDALMTPDATEKLKALIRTRSALGFCGAALQLVDVNAVSIVRAYWGDIYAESGMPYVFCQSEDEAQQWLWQRLESCDRLLPR